jgi:glycosyltransferase involved in cell wall biosynthesis
MPPRITVVTPSYNQEKFLKQTIRSVLDQQYPALEYIAMDGGSQDRSRKILEKYHESLSYWVSEQDRGQSDALNKGFAKATGDILCWINSDDILLPGSLQTVANYFAENNDVMWCTGELLGMEEHGKLSQHSLPVIENPTLLDWFLHFSKGKSIIQQPATFWRREVWENLGPLREDLHYGFDFEFFLRIRLQYGEPGRIRQPLAAFRFHDQSKTCQASEKFFLENIQIVRENLSDLPLSERPYVRQWLLKERTIECFLRQQTALQKGNMVEHWRWRLRGILHRLSGKRLIF